MKASTLLFIGLIYSLLSSNCLVITDNFNNIIISNQLKNSISCIIAKQMPENDGPSKTPYYPLPLTNFDVIGTTGSTGPSGASGTSYNMRTIGQTGPTGTMGKA